MAPTLTIDGRALPMRDGETVLECLERHGVPMLYSCRSGVCQSCLLKAVGGPVPPAAQQGLKDSLRAQGYFLSCVCTPVEDMTVALPGAGLDHRAEVLSTDDLGAAVRRVRLRPPAGFSWFAGQYVTLIREDNTARSYSVASSPADGFLELHVRRIPGGALSNWLHDVVRPGASLRLRGPFGDCFYTPGDPGAPLLLAGTGTGLSPLYGILRDALAQGHHGPIHLFHGARTPGGLYHVDELRRLAADHGVRYSACVLDGAETRDGDCVAGALDEVVLAQPLDTSATRAYLCGDPAIVQKLRKRLFLKGLSNRRIFADAFVPTTPAPG